jgi:hemoglobin
MILGAALPMLAAASSVIAACSNHDETPSVRGPSPSASASATSEPSGADAGTLYSRVGGNAGIKAIVDGILDTALRDPVLASYFGASEPRPALKATLEQDKACLVLQLGQSAGGPEVYPGQVVGGFTCRSMAAAHAGLAIDEAVFDRFIGIAAGVLKAAKVADADIATLGSALLSSKAEIVTVFRTGNDAGAYDPDAATRP